MTDQTEILVLQQKLTEAKAQLAAATTDLASAFERETRQLDESRTAIASVTQPKLPAVRQVACAAALALGLTLSLGAGQSIAAETFEVIGGPAFACRSERDLRQALTNTDKPAAYAFMRGKIDAGACTILREQSSVAVVTSYGDVVLVRPLGKRTAFFAPGQQLGRGGLPHYEHIPAPAK